MTKSRLRNLALPIGLAVLAAVLVGLYVISYRNSVNHGANLEKVLVATRDIPAGTDGASVAGGGYLKEQTVPQRAVVPGAIVSASPLTSLVVSGTIYKGEQVTLRQFKPLAQGGIFAKFSGKQRVVVVPGDPNQLLAGTASDGDHVDVVANTKYSFRGLNKVAARVVLQNLLVLKAATGSGSGGVAGAQTATATLVMTDKQSQTMLWALKNATWYLVLRPTATPRNTKPSLETLESFLTRGLPQNSATRALLLGGFGGSAGGQ